MKHKLFYLVLALALFSWAAHSLTPGRAAPVRSILPNERSSHERPTPREGGVGILAALVPMATAAAVNQGRPS